MAGAASLSENLGVAIHQATPRPRLTTRAWGTLRISMASREMPCVVLATITMSNPNFSVRATRLPSRKTLEGIQCATRGLVYI